MSRKDALSCWVNTCPPHSIWWEKEKYGSNTTYYGACKECGILYGIGSTIEGNMTVSKENWKKIQELNK